MELTVNYIESMKQKEFQELYNEKLKEMECVDKEEFNCEETEDMIKLLDLKSKELSEYLDDETIKSWSETFEGIEKRLQEMNQIFEMALLTKENHLRGVRLVYKFLKKEI